MWFFFILKIGRIKSVRCMKMGAVRGSCKNKGIVIGTRIRKRIPAQVLDFSLFVNTNVSGLFFLIALLKV